MNKIYLGVAILAPFLSTLGGCDASASDDIITYECKYIAFIKDTPVPVVETVSADAINQKIDVSLNDPLLNYFSAAEFDQKKR